MSLPTPPDSYSKDDQAQTRAQIDRELAKTLKKGNDIYIAGARLIFTAPNGNLWALSVSNAGATVWTAL